MDSGTKNEVEVWIYDLSKGLARSMSMAFVGKQIDGIWHTGIVVYGREYFYGGDSIEYCAPGGTIMGQPDSKVSLGTTEIPYEIFHEHLRELSQTTFRGCDYHLLRKNCNNFSSEIAQFLTGNDIPSHITNLPEEVLSTPFGQMMRPMLDSMTVNPGAGAHRVFGESEPSHRIARHSHASEPQSTQPLASAPQANVECVTFAPEKDIDLKIINGNDSISTQDMSLLTELIEYVSTKNVMWSISPAHVKVLGSLLSSSQNSDRSPHLWRLVQRLVVRPESLPVLKRCDNSVLMAHLQIDNVDSLQSLCNLSSTYEGYTMCLSAKRSMLQELPGALGNYIYNVNHVEVIASAILNISIHHRLADDLDIQYTCSLVEFLNSHEDITVKTVELILRSLLNFMTRNAEVKMLAFATGLDAAKYLHKAEPQQSERLKRTLESLQQLQGH